MANTARQEEPLPQALDIWHTQNKYNDLIVLCQLMTVHANSYVPKDLEGLCEQISTNSIHVGSLVIHRINAEINNDTT